MPVQLDHRTEEESDPRFTTGLYFDVIRVLEKHGYVPPPHRPEVLARGLAKLLQLVQTIEGHEV